MEAESLFVFFLSSPLLTEYFSLVNYQRRHNIALAPSVICSTTLGLPPVVHSENLTESR